MALCASADEPTVKWTTTALVSQFGVGGVEDAQRTLNFMSDSTFVIKEAFGEGTNDISLKVTKGYVDFSDVTMGSDYYSWKKITGSSQINSLGAYASYYYSWTLSHDGVYYQTPSKKGGELVITSAYAYNGNDKVGEGNFYVCWGRTRFAGTKDLAGKASLVYVPEEGTTASEGKWVTDTVASLGFYYDELVGDTVYTIHRYFGTDEELAFRVTNAGQLTFPDSYQGYLYPMHSTVYSLYPYPGYTYTWGDTAYYVQDLTKVHSGEVGFYAYAYDAAEKTLTGASNWQSNYYIFDWTNPDVEDPTALQSVSVAAAATSGKYMLNGRLYIQQAGRRFNAAGQVVQ